MQDYSGKCSLCGDTYYGSTSCSTCYHRFLDFKDMIGNNLPHGGKSRFLWWEDFRDLCKIYFPNGLTDNWEVEIEDRKLTEDEEKKINEIYRRVAQRTQEKEAEEKKQAKNNDSFFHIMDPSHLSNSSNPKMRKRYKKRHG